MERDIRLLLMEFSAKQLIVPFVGSSHPVVLLPMASLVSRLGMPFYHKIINLVKSGGASPRSLLL
jgi:hypothetical protein